MTDNAGNKKAALIVATLGSFLTPYMSTSINIALPVIGEEFTADAILLGWVTTAFILTAAIFLVPFGKLADIYGRKRIFTFGSLLFTFSSLFCALATSLPQLIGFRILQGVGSAMIFVTSVAILTSVFSPGERGRALGITIGAIYVGQSLGPVLGGILTQNFGWRSIFFVIVPFGFFAFYFAFWKLVGEWADARNERLDMIGSLIYSIALVFTIYGSTLIPSLLGFWLTLTGIAGILLFIWWEKKVAYPVLNINLFTKNRVFAFSNLAALINYSATFAVGFLLSLYLQYIKGLDSQHAGLVLVAQPLVMALISPFSGRFSDKINPKYLASSGMAITTAGLVLLIFLGPQTSQGFIVFCLMILGLGFALFTSPNTNAIMGSVGKNYYGIASATLATMRVTGQLLSMGIVMAILATNMGRAQITLQHHPLFLTCSKIAFIIFALLCCGGVFASLARDSVASAAPKNIS